MDPFMVQELGEEDARELARRFQGERDRILEILRRNPGRSHGPLTTALAALATNWAGQRDPQSLALTHAIHEGRLPNVARPEFLLDLSIFLPGRIRPLLGAEIELNFASKVKPESRMDMLLPMFLSDGTYASLSQRERERALDLLRLFVIRPEVGLFAGWANPKRGGRKHVTAEDLIASDARFVDAFASADEGNPFWLVYVAVVRMRKRRPVEATRPRPYDFDVGLFEVASGRAARRPLA